ncbi:uncharacterized protein LOC118741975 [Rhagoletis pomonella]|uniref:uncharacterized protein LOC118741975 n=1 Tax=Rhagoletis pomonella TaxID=28610 RepID=UPI0017875B90|nr:uncharacterized protein LOC118741975 [Rhagoletis pomonella]
MSKQKFCCSSREYYSLTNNLVETLIIIPRVVVCKKLKKGQVYTQTITIKNKGLYPRNLIYATDSLQDTKIIFPPDWEYDYLQPDEVIEIKVLITPTSNSVHTDYRHIYIQSEHPNITFEIPIIGKAKDHCYIPKSIDFPSSVPQEYAYYEFVAFNPTNDTQTVVVKSPPQNIKVTQTKKGIPKHDYIRILLTLKVADDNIMQDVIKLKIDSLFYETNIMHEPVTNSLYLNTNKLTFEELKYERESKLTVMICNEFMAEKDLIVTFLTDPTQLQENPLFNINPMRSQQSSMTNINVYSTNTYIPIDDDELNFFAYKHFKIETEKLTISGRSSKEITVCFHPVMLPECDFSDTTLPPFRVRTRLFFTVTNEMVPYRKSLMLKGFISGPEIELKPKEIRLRKIYMGEEHCELINVLNVDDKVNAQVKFKDVLHPGTACALVKPEEGYVLGPSESGVFNISFFSRVIGAFVVKLRFKVKNGDVFEVNVKGHSINARLKMFPEVLEYGTIPFGIPCKRLMLLVNPFLVPVAVQVTVGEDGEETPLVLNVDNADGLQPITVKDYIAAMMAMSDDEDDKGSQGERTIELISKTDSLPSYRSVGTEISTCSSHFEEEVLDAIPDFAFTIVNKIKEKKYLENREAEECVVSEALQLLLHTNYFNSLKQFSNYGQMDWNIVPFNPKEIYCDKEIIYLQPNAGKSISVLLIPNRVGLFNRSLNVRICPITEEEHDVDNTDARWDLRGTFFINSKMFTTKIWLEYNCRLPEITFTQDISYEMESIYVGQGVELIMSFKNTTNVPGFFHFDVIPADDLGELTLQDDISKYFMPSHGEVAVEGTIVFHRLGKVKLSGLIKIVGNPNGSPFHIFAEVKPTKIKLSATTIYKRQKVLEWSVVHLCIENDTPTVTSFTMRLKNYKYQYIEPSGAVLSPEGQGMYVSIFSKYYDADTYHNTLVINIRNSATIEVPLTYVVEGSPINMEPNIFNGHDCGTLMINCQDNKYETETNEPKYKKEVKLTNNGKHRYCFYIDKLRNNLAKCAIELGRGHLTVSPKTLCLEPQSEGTLYITADSCDAGIIYNEFRVRIIDQDCKLKVHTTRFTVTATFVEPEIHWCQKLIQMEYNRTHIYKDHPVLATACLKNMSDVQSNVYLKILGPFKIKQLFEHHFTKVINFTMNGLEEKEILISLHKSAIREEFCTTVDGRILCEADNKYQRSLQLKLIIRSPELRITQPDMIIFTRERETLTYVEVRNISCLDAQYKWKKVEEKTAYVADYDDTYKFSLDILSEIIRMLDIDDNDTDEDSIYQRNMTLRYQKYRCKLKQLEDPIGISTIIDELIDNLDLEHKRYMVNLVEEGNTCLSAKRCTSGEFVNKTLDGILHGLKLEDSYDISQESLDECDNERTIHFLEKSGFVKKFSEVKSALFLPPVKPGYAKTAVFILDTFGSCPQQFGITLVNLEKVMEFSSESVYLGVKPWYELFNASVRIINVTQYPITVSVSHKTVVDKSQRLFQGYAKIIDNRTFDICKFKSTLLRFEGIMGFSGQFMHEIQVTANKSEEQIIQLRGQGIMPIIAVTTKLQRPEQAIFEILDEYELLRAIYYFDVFKSITEFDEDLPVPKEEDNVSRRTIEYSLSSINTDATTSTTSSRQARFFQLMKTYVIVNNNGELPHASVLEQIIETQKFIKQLQANTKTALLLRKVHQDYVKLISSYGESMPINLKHFTTQPLPFQQQGFVFNMNQLVLGQLRKFVIDLHFYGPGKLIASVRTEVKIPGLYVDFEVKKSENHDYIFYAAEKKSASLLVKRYRNLFERIIDTETDPKVKHAHSFDLDRKEQHTRLEVDAKQRKELQNYYNSLNKSVYEDHKHHFTLCKIFSNSKRNYYSGEARLVILFKPEAKYYEEGQILEDYLYIDLHLGPTLPILLRGLIAKRD